MQDNFYAGIDIGGTKIAGALATANGKIVSRAKCPTPKDSSAPRVGRIISDLLEEMLYGRGISRKGLAGIGVGIPGVIDTARGKVIRTPNMGLSGSDFQKQLENRLKVGCVLGNDANLGTLGEKWLGAAKKARNVIGIFIGTGIGAGIIVDDRMVTGSHGAAAELGHMIIVDNGPQCSCGNRGCLEAIAGRWAIERDIRKAVKKGKKTIITKMLGKKAGPLKSKALRKALQKKDKLVTGIIKTAAQHIGTACVSIRHIFDPEMIVLGGGVMEACGDFILPVVKKRVAKDRFFSSAGHCGIVASVLGDDAIALGAITLAKERY